MTIGMLHGDNGMLPSGNLLHNYGKSPFSSWIFPWIAWWFSIFFCMFTKGYIFQVIAEPRDAGKARDPEMDGT